MRFKFTANRVTDEGINDLFSPSKAGENISSRFVVAGEQENSSMKSFRTPSHRTAEKRVGWAKKNDDDGDDDVYVGFNLACSFVCP